MTSEQKKELKAIAIKVREGILTAIHSAKSGHPGGSLSAADVLTYLYYNRMNIDIKNPQKADRDRFVLSKGHITPGLYSVLAQRGFFPVEELKTFRGIESRLQGHPNMNMTPGVDASTGSLGQGLSIACGMAKGAKLNNEDFNVYALLGDGELAEGQIWEATMFASHYKLDNLCIIVDINGLQIDGRTRDVMNINPVADKFIAFGCKVLEIDGHDFDSIENGFDFFDDNHGSEAPTVILMNTIKGKGISFMEDQAGWHGKAPNDEQYNEAMEELKQQKEAIEKE